MRKWTKSEFIKFDMAHPEIYKLFEKFSLQAARKKTRFSAKAIMHRIRWETEIEYDDREFKIDDGWISHYARKFLRKHPELEGFFETRVRKGGYHTQN